MSQIIIRSARTEDAPALLEIYRHYVENTAITFEWELPSIAEFQQRISSTMVRYPYLVLEQDGIVLGYSYAGIFKARAAYDWACEVTIYLDCSVQHCGHGRRLYMALEQELRRMGITNLYACIAVPETNDEYLTRNSEEFHAHLGYRICGTFKNCGYKFDRWYNMVWMEKIIGVHTSQQTAVTKPGNFYLEVNK